MVKALIDPKKKEEVRKALEKGDLSAIARAKPSPDANGGAVSAGGIAQNGNPLNRAAAQKRHWGVCLRDAAESGGQEAVEEALSNGADINEKDPRNGNTALTYAAARKKPALVDLLILRGADVNLQNGNGNTALMQILTNKGLDDLPCAPDITVLRALINAGTDLEIKNTNGNTAILIAAIRGQIEDTRILLENGADVATQNFHGETPIIAVKKSTAVHRGAIVEEIVELLRKYGAK